MSSNVTLTLAVVAPTGPPGVYDIDMKIRVDEIAQTAEVLTSQVTVVVPPDVAPPVISLAPIVADQTTLVVSWVTDEPALGWLEWGTTVSYGSRADGVALVLQHTLEATNLLPGTF